MLLQRLLNVARVLFVNLLHATKRIPYVFDSTCEFSAGYMERVSWRWEVLQYRKFEGCCFKLIVGRVTDRNGGENLDYIQDAVCKNWLQKGTTVGQWARTCRLSEERKVTYVARDAALWRTAMWLDRAWNRCQHHVSRQTGYQVPAIFSKIQSLQIGQY